VTDADSSKKINGEFDWLAIIIYPLAVVLMEAFWVYPWLTWLGKWPMFSEPRPALSLASVIIALAGSLLVTRIILRRKWSMSLTRTFIIGIGLVVILMILGVEYGAGYGFLSGRWFAHFGQLLANTFPSPHPVVLGISVLLYLWWRGIILGQTTSYFRDIYRSFIIGMVALIFLVIIWQISSGSGRFDAPGPEIGLNVMGFFFFGLMAIAISHIYIRRSAMPKEEAALTSVKRWLPMMLGVIGGMVLVGFGVASIFSSEFFNTIGRGANAVFSSLGKIVEYILIPLNYVFDWIFKVIQWLINLLRSEPVEMEGQGGNMTGMGLPEVAGKELPLWVTESIKWLVIAIIVAVIIFILAKAISRLRSRRDRDEIEEIHESLWSWKGLKDDLKELLNMMGQRFRRKPAAPQPYHLREDASGRLDIREIYRHLQWEGARSGFPRRRQETASEYSNRLQRSVPDSGEPLNEVTGLYENVRYGETSLPEEQVDNANSLWRTLRGLLRRLRGG
jgi:large-conductance mechanosensitive channel